MKARIKKLGKLTHHDWTVVGATFDVDHVIPGNGSGLKTAFYAHVPSNENPAYCLLHDCSFLGGNGSEWELIDDDTQDAYDRAMGVL